MTNTNKNRPGYKKTKIGWIPEDWEITKLRRIADIQGGYAFKSNKLKSDGKYQIVKMSNVYNNKLDLTRNPSFIDLPDKRELQYLLKSGEIIMTLTGTVGKRDYGYSVLITNQSNLLLNQRVCRLIAIENVCYWGYLIFLVKTNYFLDRFFLISRGGTGNQANVGVVDLATIKIPLPPLQEQKKIAEILSTWDKAIAGYDSLITKYELRKKALMQRLLTGKTRFKEFEGQEWKVVRLKDILKTIVREVDFNDDILYTLISVRRRSEGIFFREPLYGHQIMTKNLRVAKEGDFLISKMQIVHGASSLVTREFDNTYISGSYIALIPKNHSINIEFFNWLSKMPVFYHKTYRSSYGVHIEKMTFNLKLFMTEKFRIPENLEEQRKIASVLTAQDRQIDLLKKQKAQLEQQKKGLMQKLLTGEVRVQV